MNRSRVLVDTCVWSLHLRRPRHKLSTAELLMADELDALIQQGRVEVAGPVRQEILTGVRDRNIFVIIRERLKGFPDLRIEVGDYELAAEICNRCASAGMAWAAIDALLCAIALNRDWSLLTTDKDFRNYAKLTGLSLYAA